MKKTGFYFMSILPFILLVVMRKFVNFFLSKKCTVNNEHTKKRQRKRKCSANRNFSCQIIRMSMFLNR